MSGTRARIIHYSRKKYNLDSMQRQIRVVSNLFMQGVRDSARVDRVFRLLRLPEKTEIIQSTRNTTTTTKEEDEVVVARTHIRQVRSHLFECALLNLFIFAASLLAFEQGVMFLLDQYVIAVSQDGGAFLMASGSTVHWLMSWAFYTAWVYPVWLLSFFMNTYWHRHIAHGTFCLVTLRNRRLNRNSQHVLSWPGMLQIMSEEVYRNCVMVVLVLQMTLVSYVPYVGDALYVLHLAWTYSWHSHEYLWSAQQCSFATKKQCMERDWAYHCGFGFSQALLTRFFPNVYIGKGIFAFYLPVCIMVTMLSTISGGQETRNKKPPQGPKCLKLPLLFMVSWMTSQILLVVSHLFMKKQRRATSE